MRRILYCLSCITITISFSMSLPNWTNQRFVFTIYNANHTWNEAREICRNNDQWLLSMEDRNAWSMWKLLLIPTESLPRRLHEMRYWMDVHNRDPNNKTDFYHDNCSHVTYLEWDDSTRSSYVVDHPCVLFDVYWVPFGTNVHKYWLGMPCNTEHDFVCMKLMDELPCVHSCNESVYLAPKSDVECEAYCGQLLGCRHRFLTLDDFTVCHIIRSSFINDDPFYNICYLQDLYSYNVRYCDPQGSYNMSYTPNKEPNVTDLCAEPETTTEVIQTTTEVLTTLATTEGTTAKMSCECPCSVTVNITDSNLTLAEKVEQLKKELTVNKRNTSAHRRSKISMADHRVSATSIGSLGVVILSVVLGSICMLDLTRVRCDKIKRNCSKSKSKRIGDSKEVLPNIKLIKLETKSTPS